MNKQKWLLVILLLFAAGVRAVLLGRYDLWHVEAESAWLSLLPFPVLVDTLAGEGMRPPLYFWVLKLWGLVSLDEAWLRLLSLVLSVAAVGIVYKAGKRLFCWRTGIVAGALAAASPLLAASAGVEVMPQALDLFLGALMLFSFVRLLQAPHLSNWLFHGVVAAAGLYTNLYLAAFLLVEGLFLLLTKLYRPVLPKWGGAALVALLLFSPWLETATHQMDQRFGQDDLISDQLGPRISVLFTQLSLGRLYAWYPLTPVVTFTPAPMENEDEARRRPDPFGEDTLAGALQAMQMMALGLMGMLALAGAVAAMRFSAWPLPVHLKISKLHARITQVNRQNAVLLLLLFAGPILLAALVHWIAGWKFESSELIFLAVPFLILAARGIGTLEWRVMYYAALISVLSINLFFTFASRGLGPLTHGIGEATLYLEGQQDLEIGDAIVHERPLTFFPVMFYSRGGRISQHHMARSKAARAWGGGYLEEGVCLPGPEDLAQYPWIWWIRLEPEAGNPYEGAVETEDDAALSWDPPPRWEEKEVARFGNVTMTLYGRRSVGD